VDEAQNFTTDTVAELFAEARKFGLYLTLANQNLAQLRAEAIDEAVLGNVGNLFLFRLGAPDAERLAVYTRPEVSAQALQNLPNFHAVAHDR